MYYDKMKTVIKKNTNMVIYLAAMPRKRLLAWKSICGVWSKKKPDPIRELAKMRKEWAR